ncbi:hypothetical protein [Arthrobacter sp. HY1533]|uniref:hypothetical protein n=1 Tax=Arthrobacter sp. HY1533 TaxID=2970919 RepID=UPI0022B9F059|nr:hypothetical protein [Arthrobacter sp. HY1533]
MMSNEQAMKAMEEATQGIAMINGLRQQLIDAGWDPGNAEMAVVSMLNATNKS